MNKSEIVFEVGAEGGSIIISREISLNSEIFIYHHSEFDLSDEEGLGVSKSGAYSNFEAPFQRINQKYPWFLLHLLCVHKDYRQYVLEELVNKLNQKPYTPTDLSHSKKHLEEVLEAKLNIGYLQLKTDVQNITITNLMKLTEYDYLDYTQESGKKSRIRGKYEIWTYDQYDWDMEIITGKTRFTTVGKLEFSGNTIIIKNEANQVEYAFSSDKFFVFTNPILSKTKNWFYVPNN